MTKNLRSLAILPVSCLLMSLLLILGTPYLSGCRASSAEQEDGQDIVVKDNDASTQSDAQTDQGMWMVSKIVSTYTYEDESSEHTVVYERDERGNIVSVRETDANGFAYTETYTRDENGIMLSMAYEMTSDDYSDSAKTEYTCETDDAGRPVRYEATDGSETYEYTYDADGNRTQAVVTRVFTVYDEGTGEEDSPSAAGEETQVVTYTYDADGNQTSSKNVGDGYASASETTYERDADGRVVKSVTTSWSEDSEGNRYEDSVLTTTVTYQYDDAGNLVRCDYESDGSERSDTYEWVLVETPSAVSAAEGQLSPVSLG